MTALSTLADTAVELALIGWHVFPLGPRSKKPAIPKHKGGNGFEDATTDLDQIRPWWTTDPRCGPRCNVGVATGASRLLVIDLDPTHDDDGHCADALTAFCALAADVGGGGLPETFEVVTPRGGEHWYFRVPDGVELPPSSVGRIAPHVDVRSAGGYVVAAGSVVDIGEYVVGKDAPIADAPMWLIELCRRVKSADRFERPAVVRTAPPAGPTDRRSRWGLKALEGELGRLAVAPEGKRHDELYRSSHALGGLVASGVLSASHVAGELAYVARRIGLPDHEIQATVLDGLETGMARPREVPA